MLGTIYNLRSKSRKREYSPEHIHHYSSGDMAEKDMRIVLSRMPILDNPSNHKCVFQLKNGNKIVIKKNEDLGNREKIIAFLILFSFFTSIMILAIYYKDESKAYGTYLGKRLVVLPNKLRTFNTTFFNSLFAKYNVIFRGKIYNSVLKNRKGEYRLKRRSDVCYNDIRDFIKEPWVSEEKIIKGPVSFIEEQCRMLRLVPKTADHMQFSFNNTDVGNFMDVNSLTDYASYDKGARILSTSGAEPYVEYKIQSGILQYILGIKYFKIYEFPICRISETLCRYAPGFLTGPFSLLQPWKKPGECWSFKGTRGRVQIELSERIFITAVSLEHIPPDFATTGSIHSAPAQFSIIGIDGEGYKFTTRKHLGTYRYLLNEPNIQTFLLPKEDSYHPYKIIELSIESNHGNENYTCVYRLRVHGRPVDSLSN